MNNMIAFPRHPSAGGLDDPSGELSEAIDVAYDALEGGKYGKPDKYNKHLLGVGVNRKEIEESISIAKHWFGRLEKMVNYMLAARTEDKRQEIAKQIRGFTIKEPRKSMASLEVAIRSCSVEIDDLREEFQKLDRMYDALVSEIENPRHLEVLNKKSIFKRLTEGRKRKITQKGFEEAGTFEEGNIQPFSLAYDLQQSGIIQSTREVSQLAIFNGSPDDKQQRKIDIYLKRENK